MNTMTHNAIIGLFWAAVFSVPFWLLLVWMVAL
jgi:hypothetical protein